MVFKPAYLEVNPHAINPKNIYEGLDLSGVCGWVEKYKGDAKYSGWSGSSFQPASISSRSKLELTLDEAAADGGAAKSANDCIKYWNEIQDGRVMASLGDLYANFKIIQQMREQGTAQEQAKAQSYLNSLCDDFDRHGQEGGLIANTRLFYSPTSLDARIMQHYQCRKPELTKERIIKVLVYGGTLIEEVAQTDLGLTYLQATLDTEDDAETIIKTFEFISRVKKENITLWTPSDKSRNIIPERAVWLGALAGRFGLGCGSYPINFYGRFRGVRG